MFERICERHNGGTDENGKNKNLLFDRVKQDIKTLKLERYNLRKAKRTRFEDKVITEFRKYLGEELDRLKRKNCHKETLKDCKVFETSFVNRSDDAEKLK